MKVFGACIVSIVLLAALLAHPDARAGDSASGASLQAGMAEIDITPPVGFRMAGYFDERLSTGIHDPLMAKALVLQQGGQRFALVFCDLVGPSLHVTTNARARASRQTGIAVTNIVIAATHSHTGPLFDDIRRDVFHETAVARFNRDPQETVYYPDFLADRLVQVIARANSEIKPAEMDVGITTQPGLPFNRRFLMKDGKVVCNPGQLNPDILAPSGPVDSDLSLLLVKIPGRSQPIGGLTVFAMHADTIGGTLFSADYPFFIQQTLRHQFGSNFISAFGAGTCGDLNHIDVSKKEPVAGFAVAEKIGAGIGKTLIADLPNLKPIPHPSLASQSFTLQIPVQTVSAAELAEAGSNLNRLADPKLDFSAKVRAVKSLDLARNGPTYPMEVQVFRLDADTAVVCLPAEIFVELGLALKRSSPFKQTIVISVCNDRPNYIPTRRAFQEGGYEVVNSRLIPGAGEAMVETAIKMLLELK